MALRYYFILVLITAVATALLMFLPPFHHLTQRFLTKLPPFAFLRTQELLSSAHESLVLTAALEVDLFTHIHNQYCQEMSQTHTLAEVSAGRSQQHPSVQNYCMPGARLSQTLFGTHPSLTPPVGHDEFFQALVALGALDHCEFVEPLPNSLVEGGVAGFALNLMSARYLVKEHACSLDQEEGPWWTTPRRNVDYLGGMGLIANSRQVLTSLLNLPEFLQDRRVVPLESRDAPIAEVRARFESASSTAQRFFMIPLYALFLPDSTQAISESETKGVDVSTRMATAVESDEDDGALWTIFANHSDTFVRDVALGVAGIVKSSLLSNREKSASSPGSIRIVDIGGGSGEFLAQTALSLSTTHDVFPVLFDLPPVVATAQQRRERLGILPKLNYVGGNAFDAKDAVSSIMNAGDSTQKSQSFDIAMMNSFLQHFTAKQCVDLLISLAFPVITPGKKEVHQKVHSKRHIAVVELVKPNGPYNPWTELLTMPRIFSVMLGALTNGTGLVRTKAEYLNIFDVFCRGAVKGEASSCQVRTASLFPMPAALFMVELEFKDLD